MTIFETTRYWAHPGQDDAVLATRIDASRIRLALGLPAGEIRRRIGDGDGPTVSWSQSFPSAEAHAADLAARADSTDFTAVRARMSALIARFERQVEAVVTDPEWAGSLPYAELSLVPEEVWFESAGRRLAAYLYTPPGPGPFPAVIYNHGSGLDQGSLDSTSPGVAAQFLSWGYAVLLPHRHGYGKSPGPGWRSEVTEEPFSEAYNQGLLARLDRESDDVVAAFAFLARHPGIDPGRIAVAGSSFGGVNTLFAALKEPRFRAAVEFAGAAMNWDRNPLLADAMLEAARRLTPPIFFAQAENDYSIRPTRELAAARAETGRPVASKLYSPFGFTPLEGHFLAGRGPALWAADVRQFLARWV